MTCHTISPDDSPRSTLVPTMTTAPTHVAEDLLEALAPYVARLEAGALFPQYEPAAALYALMSELAIDGFTLPDGRIVRRRATCIRRTDCSIEIETGDGSCSIYEAGYEEETIPCN